MTQTITIQTDQKQIGIGTKVQITGEVKMIAGNFKDKSGISTLTIEVTEFEKLYRNF